MNLSRKLRRVGDPGAALAAAVIALAGLAGPASAQPSLAAAAPASRSQPAVPGSQSAQPATPASANVIVVRVCNRSVQDARVAISYQPVNSTNFYNQGWYPVRANACAELANTTNAYFYGYAEVENRSSDAWTGTHGLCVQYPGPFAFWSSTGTNTCGPGQQLRNFVVLHATGWGIFTWNLNP
jgi:uncharacterized membrane protein